MTMNKKSSIYVAGHRGLMGSALVENLKKSGYNNILSADYEDLDLTNRMEVDNFFSKERPEYVFLAAARVGSIKANILHPAEFIFENLAIQTNVIDSAYRHKVKKLIFLGSSCMYPKDCKQPMKEAYLMQGPLETTSEPFAIAKLAGIKMCQAYNRQYKTNFISMVAANVYGINDHIGENAHVILALIQKFHEAKIKGYGSVTVWGSGQPKREFLYADDLANCCIFLMNNYDSSEVINIGTGIETSIKEIAALIKRIVGFKGGIIYNYTMPDGNMRRLLDIAKIKKLGWKARIDIVKGLKLSYDWFKSVY